MKNIFDLFKVTKNQLGRIPSVGEMNELSNKPSVLLALRNKERRNEIKDSYEKYLKCPNQSWYILLRNLMLANPKNIAIIYRGTIITNEEATLKIDKVATKLYRLGIRKGDVVPVCMANTPEFFYTLCALNLLGATCKRFSIDYPLADINDILENSTDKVLISTDHEYAELEDYSKRFKRILLSSRGDSIKYNAEPPKEYSDKLKEELKRYYHYKNTIPYYARRDKRVKSLFDSLLNTHPDKNIIKRSINRKNDANEISSISYSLDSETNTLKTLEHSNSSVIISAFRKLLGHPEEPSLEGLISMVNIPNDSNLGVSNMLDIAFQKGIIALEPEFSTYSFLDTIYLNQPNIVYSPTNMYLSALKRANNFIDDGIEDKMPWLLLPTTSGDPLGVKEEKILNSFLLYEKAGIGIKFGHKKESIQTVMSVSSGDSASGEMFSSRFKHYKNIFSRNKTNCEYGLEVHPDIEIAVLNPYTLEEVDFGETGLLVIKKSKTSSFNSNRSKDDVITDAYEREWYDTHIEGQMNSNGTFNILGKFPPKMRTSQGVNISLNEINALAVEVDRVFQACTVYSKEEHCLIINYSACKNKEDKKYGVEKFAPYMADDIKEQLREKIAEKYGSFMLGYIKVRRIQRFPLNSQGEFDVNAIKQYGLKKTENLSPIYAYSKIKNINSVPDMDN